MLFWSIHQSLKISTLHILESCIHDSLIELLVLLNKMHGILKYVELTESMHYQFCAHRALNSPKMFYLHIKWPSSLWFPFFVVTTFSFLCSHFLMNLQHNFTYFFPGKESFCWRGQVHKLWNLCFPQKAFPFHVSVFCKVEVARSLTYL